jgi:hypothetical protein
VVNIYKKSCSVIKSMDVINNSSSSSSLEDEEFLFVRRTKICRGKIILNIMMISISSTDFGLQKQL